MKTSIHWLFLPKYVPLLFQHPICRPMPIPMFRADHLTTNHHSCCNFLSKTKDLTGSNTVEPIKPVLTRPSSRPVPPPSSTSFGCGPRVQTPSAAPKAPEPRSASCMLGGTKRGSLWTWSHRVQGCHAFRMVLEAAKEYLLTSEWPFLVRISGWSWSRSDMRRCGYHPRGGLRQVWKLLSPQSMRRPMDA